jgi:hypothetical protein
MVGKSKVVCFVCLLNRSGIFISPPTILPLDTPIPRQKPWHYCWCSKSNFKCNETCLIISTALECIVIFVSDTNFFDAEVQELLQFTAS